MDQYNRHLQSNCCSHCHQTLDSPSRMTLKDVLEKPTSSPATVAEKKVAEHLVRRILGNGGTEGKVLKLSTRGQASKTTIILINTIHSIVT